MAIVVRIWSRIPFTIVAIVITVDTPITTPRIVRLERSLFVRSASTAMPTFSRSWSAETKRIIRRAAR